MPEEQSLLIDALKRCAGVCGYVLVIVLVFVFI